jgi:hypothetical protein
MRGEQTMKHIISLPLAAGLAIAIWAGNAPAQINSPPPALMGQPSYHLYSVPGVIASAGLRTFFACTNTTSANIRVGVELFFGVGGPAANDPSATSLDLPPGTTHIFGTSSAVGISVDSVLGFLDSGGSARIVATESKGIICTAFLADDANAPPASMADLKVVKKTKQRGE